MGSESVKIQTPNNNKSKHPIHRWILSFHQIFWDPETVERLKREIQENGVYTLPETNIAPENG